jgi:hypothetical protein
VNRVALTRIVLLLLLMVSVQALGQSEASLRHSPTAQSKQESFPDAPSADSEHPSTIVSTTGTGAVSPGLQPILMVFDTTPTSTDSSIFFDRYLYPSLLNRGSRYRPVAGGRFIRRVSDAASHLLIVRDDSGNTKLNDSYLSAVLTSAVVQTAYTPYWSRSASTPFSNLGSTIGSDAGLNVFHEFEPDLRHVILGHTPRFVSRIEDRIIQSR